MENENSEKVVCTKCIYDTTLPSITFDEEGVCNYCRMIDDLEKEYKTGKPEGEAELDRIVEQIKKDGKGKKYDCIIGVSGGTDSSYMMYWAKQKGLRPLAAHFDNTYNTSIATQNIQKITSKLGIDLYTHVVDNKEMDDIYRSFFLSDVTELDCSTDIALAEVLYRAAAKFKVKYVLEGHSFLEEGITPLGKGYFDGKYISGIHKKFGKIKMKTFPNMPFWSFIKWTAFLRIKKIRPFWYMHYTKHEAKEFMKKEFDWQDYGGHHLENRISAFAHSYYLPKKFEIDYRNKTLGAQIRNGYMTRAEALKEYASEPHLETGLIDYIKKRMEFSDEEFNRVMKAKPKMWTDYATYKKRFELLRPLFYLMYKSFLVPKSFYMKYCFPVKYNK